MKKSGFLIPTLLLQKVSDSIDINYQVSQLDEKSRQKLTKRLVELWYFIYQKQINDDSIKSLKYYIDIHNTEFRRFDIMVSGVRLTYKDLLNILGSLIGCNGSYLGGKYSYGWRVNTDFLQVSKLTEFNIDFNIIFKGSKNKDWWINKYPNQCNLIEDAYNSTIDLDSYLYWLLNNIGKELNPVYNKKTGMLERRFLTEERVYHHFNLALKVNIKNLWFKLSDEGRFYSSISNLPSGSIDFIKLRGYNTIRIDVKNCQPLLLSTMIKSDEFKNDCLLGIFYDKLSEILKLDRGRVKLICYKHIFFGSKPLKSGRVYDAMILIYGDVIEQINHIKEDISLAKELQRRESNIFVSGIGKIKIPKLLRHDEVIVVGQDSDKIKEYLRKEFNKYKIKLII